MLFILPVHLALVNEISREVFKLVMPFRFAYTIPFNLEPGNNFMAYSGLDDRINKLLNY